MTVSNQDKKDMPADKNRPLTEEEKLNEQLKETSIGSDPVTVTHPTGGIGAPDTKRDDDKKDDKKP